MNACALDCLLVLTFAPTARGHVGIHHLSTDHSLINRNTQSHLVSHVFRFRLALFFTSYPSHRYVPSEDDVIVSWARQNHAHRGNERFRMLVDKYAPVYAKASTKYHKSEVIAAIVTEVRSKSRLGGTLSIDQNRAEGFVCLFVGFVHIVPVLHGGCGRRYHKEVLESF